jgi:hypothetical protein
MMVNEQTLRPYATAGIALVGASIIAVTPLVAPPPSGQVRAIQLVDAWSDLFTDTADNWHNILSGEDTSAVTQLFSDFATNPDGVIGAFANLTPTITTDITSLPGEISVQLPPGLELGIAELGAWGALLTSVNDVLPQLMSDPSSLYEDVGTVLNGLLNGEDNISLLDGTINIAGFNGLLAPLQSVDVNLNLTDLINALGLGNLDLSSLNLTGLLSQLGLNDVTLGSLFTDLGLSGDKLGDLLDTGSGVTTVGGLLNLLGLGSGLDVGSLGLTSVLSDLGLDTNVNLSDLSLNTVLNAFGINPTIDLGLGELLDKLGFSSLVNEGLGTLLNNLNLLQPALTDLDGVLNDIPGLSTLLSTIGLTPDSLLSLSNLETALNTTTVDALLGGQSIDEDVSSLLTALGVSVPDNLTVGGILEDLGFSSSTADLTLSQLLGDLGGGANSILDLPITDLLNGFNLGDLLGDLGLSGLQVNLTDLGGNLSGLTVADLLGDLGLGDVASISVDPVGGLITELVDTVPQQILAAL